MSRTEILGNAFISLAETEFNCPKCTCHHGEDDYYDKLYKSKKGYIYISCKGCKTKISVSSNIKGDVVNWLKEDE